VPGGHDGLARIMREIADAALALRFRDGLSIVGRLADDLVAAAPDMLGHFGIARIIGVLLNSKHFGKPGIVMPVDRSEDGIGAGRAPTETPVDGIRLMARIPAEPQFRSCLADGGPE